MKKPAIKIILFIILFFCIPVFVLAQYFYTPQLLIPYTSDAPEINSVAAVLIDAETGALLYSKNPDMEIPPASLTKLMAMHIVMNEVKEGRASYDDIVPITVESWAQSQPPRSSLMFLEPRHTVTLREIMLGLAISSGNDAAVAIALKFAPGMQEFVDMMNSEARRLGLIKTRFVESSGISEYNMTTAEEFTWFCRQYIKLHPQSLRDFHSVHNFIYPTAANVPASLRNRFTSYDQPNRNTLLYSFRGVDGLKTGYIDESGYNIALTAHRDFTRFITVILGADTARLREADGSALLSWAFENFKTVYPVIGKIENERLWKGKTDEVELILADTAVFTSPSDRAGSLIYETIIDGPIIAPVSLGTIVGYYVISDSYGELNRIPLVTTADYERGNIFKRIWHSILLFFLKNRYI